MAEFAHALTAWTLQQQTIALTIENYYIDFISAGGLLEHAQQINFYMQAGDTYWKALQPKVSNWEAIFVLAQKYYALALQLAERNSIKESLKLLYPRINKLESAMLKKLKPAPSSSSKTNLKEEEQGQLDNFRGQLRRAQQDKIETFQQVVNAIYKQAEHCCQSGQYELAFDYYQLIIEKVDEDQRYHKGRLQSFDTQELTRRIARVHALKQQQTYSDYSSWRAMRQRLDTLRQRFNTHLQDYSILQRKFTADIRALLFDLAQECTTILGEPPCPFSLLGKGSLSRGDMCPYSDADIALLIADDKCRNHLYFRQFLQLFSFKLMLLGESTEIFPGLQVDSTDRSALFAENSEYINTPEGFAKHVDPQTVDVSSPQAYSLHRPIALYTSRGGETLEKSYLELLQARWQQSIPYKIGNNNPQQMLVCQYQAWAYCQEDLKRLKTLIKLDESKPTIDIKQRYLAPLTRWCYAMALYQGWLTSEDMEIAVILKKLEQQACLYPTFIARLQQALITLQSMRIQLHQEAGYQMDVMLKPDAPEQRHVPWRRLTVAAFDALRALDVFVLQPAYEGLSTTVFSNWLSPVPFDPLANYIQQQFKHCLLLADKETQQQQFKAVQQNLIEIWANCQAPIEVYRDYYRQLPEVQRTSAFNAIMLAEQTAKLERRTALHNLLANFPEINGTRLLAKEQQNAWENSLKQVLNEQGIPSSMQANSQRFFKTLSAKNIQMFSRLTGFKPIPLAPVLLQALFDDNGHLRESALPGRHRVFAVTTAHGAFHCKIYPEFPGIEYAVNVLHRLIIGHGTPLNELVKVTVDKHCYPMLISKTIPGQPLHQVTRSLQTPLPRLETKHFSQLVLVAMLINPEDGKPDNYILETFQNPLAVEEMLYQLVGIDNDHAFIDSVIQQRSGNEIRLLLQSKVILYCFDQMQQPLHPEAVEEFLILDPEKVLHLWLQELMTWEENIHQLFTETERMTIWQQHNENEKTLLALILKEGLIQQLYQSFYRLQTLLQQQPQITAIELLLKLDALLGSFYRDALAENITPQQRFLKLTAKAYKVLSDGSSLTTLTTLQTLRTYLNGHVPDKKSLLGRKELALQQCQETLQSLVQQRQTLTKVRKALLEGDVKPFQALSLDAFKEQVIAGIIWSHLANKQQAIILKSMTGTSFCQLNFQGCTALTTQILAEILEQSPGLQKLTIRDNEHLNDTIVMLLARCPVLEVLYLSDLPKLKQLNISSLFGTNVGQLFRCLRRLRIEKCQHLQQINFIAQKLERLTVRNCLKLSRCQVLAPNLQRLQINSCEQLIALRTQSKVLVSADLNGCAQLSEKELNQMALKSLSLSHLGLQDCHAIPHIAFRKRYPFLQPLAFAAYSPATMIKLDAAIQAALQATGQTLTEPVNRQPIFNQIQQWQIFRKWIIDITLKKAKTAAIAYRHTKEVIDALAQLEACDSPVIEYMLEVLGSSEEEDIRQTAVEALARLGVRNEEIIKALLKALWGKENSICVAAMKALIQLGAGNTLVTKTLLEALSDKKKNVRSIAIEILGHLDPQDSAIIKALLKASGDKEAYIRGKVMEAFGQLGSRVNAVITALEQGCKDKDAYVRQMAFKSLIPLSAHDGPVLIKVLLEAFEDEDACYIAIEALVRLGTADMRVIEALLKVLKNNEDARGVAIKALARLIIRDDKPVINALVEALEDKEKSIRAVAMETLGQLGIRDVAVIRALLEAWEDAEENIRQIAMETLGQLGLCDATIINALLEKLKDKEKQVRRTAIRTIGQLGVKDGAVISALLEALEDEEEYIRQTAMETLGQLGACDMAILKALLEKLKDKEEQVRRVAAKVLGQLGVKDTAVHDALLEALGDKDKDVRQAAVEALGALDVRDALAIKALLKKLGDRYYDVRQTTIEVLNHLGVSETDIIKTLLKELESKDNDADVRQTTIKTLVQLKTCEAPVIKTLLKTLKDKDANVRQMTIEALGQLGVRDVSVIKALLETLNNRNTDIQRVTIEALGQLAVHDASIIEALLKKLNGKNVYEAVIKALIQLGAPPATINKALLGALKGKDKEVQQTAIKVLGQLSQPSYMQRLLTFALKAFHSSLQTEEQNTLDPNVQEYSENQPLKTFNDKDEQQISSTRTPGEDNLTFHRQEELKAIAEQRQTLSTVRQALLAGDTKLFQTLSLNIFKEEVVHGIDWPSLTTEQQTKILEVITDVGFQVLNLQGCRALNTQRLAEILQHSPTLQKLVLSSNEQIDDSIVSLLVNCPMLEALHFKALPKLTQFNMEGEVSGNNKQLFRRLRHLHIEQCDNLREINFTVRHLERLSIRDCGQLHRCQMTTPGLRSLQIINCHNLTTLRTQSKALVEINEIDLTDCTQLPEIELSHLTIQSLALNALKLSGCSAISHIAFWEQYPFLLPLAIHSLSKELVIELDRAIQAALLASNQTVSDLMVRQQIFMHLQNWVALQQNDKWLQVLRDALEDKNRKIRQAAAGALARLGDTKAILLNIALSATVEEERDIARQEAVQGLLGVLGTDRDPITALLAALKDKELPEHRRAAAEILGRLGQTDTNIISALLIATGDKRANVRRAAIEALGKLGIANANIIALLVLATKTNKWTMRHAAITALSKLGIADASVIVALMITTKDDNWAVRLAAVEALGILGPIANNININIGWVATTKGQVTGTVREVDGNKLMQTDAPVQVTAREAAVLNSMMNNEKTVSLLALIKDVERLTQFYAVAIPDLLTAITDKDEYVRRVAVKMLAKFDLGDARVIRALLTATEDKDNEVRWTSIGILDRLCQPSSIQTSLTTALKALPNSSPKSLPSVQEDEHDTSQQQEMLMADNTREEVSSAMNISADPLMEDPLELQQALAESLQENKEEEVKYEQEQIQQNYERFTAMQSDTKQTSLMEDFTESLINEDEEQQELNSTSEEENELSEDKIKQRLSL